MNAPEYPKAHNLLEGKSVLITAAAGTGIGFAAARRCAEEGARVILSDIHERRLAEAASKLEQVLGHRPPTILCNVTSESDVERMFAFAIAEAGGIDVLINNAGLGGT